MTDTEIDVGSRIRAYRKRIGISLTELSRLTGIAASNLSSIELNKTSPTLGTILKIAEAFGMRVAPFLDEVLYRKAVVRKGKKPEQPDNGQMRPRSLNLTDDVMLNMMDARIIHLLPNMEPVLAETPGTDRFAYCLEGEISVEVKNDHFYCLVKGDSIYLLPDAVAYFNVTEGPGASLLLVNAPGIKSPRA
jgi:DNA-binding XRE family transcriptional regulator